MCHPDAPSASVGSEKQTGHVAPEPGSFQRKRLLKDRLNPSAKSITSNSSVPVERPAHVFQLSCPALEAMIRAWEDDVLVVLAKEGDGRDGGDGDDDDDDDDDNDDEEPFFGSLSS